MLNTNSITTKEQMMDSPTRSVKNLKESDVFGGKPFDGVYFKKIVQPEEERMSFQFMRFPDGTFVENNEELATDCWLILLFEQDNPEEDYTVLFYECYLGDALYFSKNQAKAGSQGIVIKKSVPGYTILFDLIKQLDLDTIKTAIHDDFEIFKVHHSLT